MARKAFDELLYMIDHAVDLEELEDIGRMILEASDLTFTEKEALSRRMAEVRKKCPELRPSRRD